MIDPKILRERPDELRGMLNARAIDYDLDALVEADSKWRKVTEKVDAIRRTRNEAGRNIAALKKSKKDATVALENMNNVSKGLEALEKEQSTAWEEYVNRVKTLPNVIHKSVPRGPDSESNLKIKSWGQTVHKKIDHIDLLEKKGLLDMERAAKVAGARFYFLKGDMVLLNNALVSFALDFATEHGYTAIQPPYMINQKAMEGSVITDDFEDSIYKIEDENLYMIGTSEHAMAAMHQNEILEGATLPIRYAGISTCFRKEAGAHGRDQKGIFRVHQFEKVEQFVFTKPEDSWKEHERMRFVAEEFYRKLEIPFQTVLLSSGDMGKVSAKTYDLEGWMAGQGAYREMVSCSNCLDYQARRLMIRYRQRTNEDSQYVHTLNSTLVATTRTLVAITELCSNDDGEITVPKVLRKYINKDKI